VEITNDHISSRSHSEERSLSYFKNEVFFGKKRILRNTKFLIGLAFVRFLAEDIINKNNFLYNSIYTVELGYNDHGYNELRL
jgi:hypothetical protein